MQLHNDEMILKFKMLNNILIEICYSIMFMNQY